MSDAVVMVGASHRTAPLAIRERLAVPRSRQVEALRSLAARVGARECFWLSTCNRGEVYAIGAPEDVLPTLIEELTDRGGLDPDDAGTSLYQRTDAAAVEHLLRVAAGLDSLVLGEVQILGQLRQAHEAAREAGSLGARTEALLRHALQVGRRVRHETGISRGAGSVSTASIRLARAVCGDLADRTVLVIGAGEVAELVTQALLAAGVRRSWIVNRTPHRAQRLADRFGGRAMPYERTHQLLAEADIVISSTDAPHPVVRAATLRAVRARRDDPICIIDLAVPRDVEPAVADLPGVHLYNVDSLRAVVDHDLAGRARAIEAAEGIVAEAAADFGSWLAARRVAPDVAAFRDRAHRTRLRELGRWQSRLASLEPDERETVAALTRSIVNKLLHTPTVRLKQAAAGPDGEVYRRALRDLFALDEHPFAAT